MSQKAHFLHYEDKVRISV